LKVLPVSDFYFRSTLLDFLHPIFTYEASRTGYLRYCNHTGQNTAKWSVPGALEAKPEVEICRRHVFPTQRPRLPIRLRLLYGVYLAPLRLHRLRILTLAHCNGRGTWNIFASRTPKSDLSRFFSNVERNLFQLRKSDFLNIRMA